MQKQIEGLDEEQQARWLAAVCHKVHCSQGLSPDDPHYNTFNTLELAGSDYTAELTQLEASELFIYTRKDATEDFLSRHDKGITRFTGIVQTLAGVGGAAGSAAGGAVLCVSGLGCGLGALISSAGMTAGIEEYREGIAKLTTEYTVNQGNRVAASFHPETHPTEQSRVDELGRVAVVAAAELAVGRLGLLQIRGYQVNRESRHQLDSGLNERHDKVNIKTPSQDNNNAININALSALRGKLSGLEKAQKAAVRTKQLPDGRIRYYSKEVPARTKGPTRGACLCHRV